MAERTPLQKALRSSARLGLWGSFVVTTGLFLLLSPWVQRALNFGLDTDWSNFDFAAERSVQNLQALLQIDTTEQTGSELAAANYLAGVLREAGIEPTVEELIEERANVWAFIEGKSPEALILHSHLDTDPIRQPERWKFEPFGGEIDPPWIYGRGAFDMKSVTSAQLEAFLRVQQTIDETGELPERSLMLLATSSEETGSHLGAQWIVRQHPELMDTGVGVADRGRRRRSHRSQDDQVLGHVVHAETLRRGLGLHPDAAASRGSVRRPVDPGPPDRRPFSHRASARVLALVRTDERRGLVQSGSSRILISLSRILEDFFFLPPYMQALFRDEVHAFPIEEDPGTQGYRMRMIVHLRPGQDLERAMDRLLPDWMVHGLGMTVEGPFGAPVSSPLDHPVFTGIQEILRERFDTVATGPFFLSLYANDSRFFRGAGIPSYGFSPFLALATDAATINGPDERIALPAFVGGVDLYHEVVVSLLQR